MTPSVAGTPPEVTVVPLHVRIRRDEVRHFLGYPEGRDLPARVAKVLEPLLAEARDRVEARGAWRGLAVDEAAALGLEPVESTGLVVGLVTIGGKVEALAAERLAAGKATAALILDAAGSAAVEEAADRLGALVVGGAPDESLPADPGGVDPARRVSCRISPGYGRWRLDAQRELFARLPHAALGVELTPSLLMTPRKSISFAMWLGAEGRPLAGLSGCARCRLESCRYRRAEAG